MAHLKYKSNEACQALWDSDNKLPVYRSLGKRPHESDDEGATEETAYNSQQLPRGSVVDQLEYAPTMHQNARNVQNDFARITDDCVMGSGEWDDGDDMLMFDNDDGIEEVAEEEKEGNGDDAEEMSVDTEILEDFKEYCAWAAQNTGPLSLELEAGIQLMALLIKQRAPLNLYNKIFKWHVNNLKATTHTPKNKLLTELKKRYNMTNKGPKVIRNFELPYSGSIIDLVVQDFKQQVQSLLSDPRFTDDDYLFFDDDPFASPPNAFTTIGDINTGRAYRKTYEKLITKPGKQVLLPILFYMDGAITGMYDHLPIEALKFTIGILNAKARDRFEAWKTIGYVTQFLKEDTTAKDIIREEAGMDADCYLSDPASDSEEEEDDDETARTGTATRQSRLEDELESEEEEEEEDGDSVAEPTIASCSAQDLHAMLNQMLASYREVESGFKWDMHYKGKTHQIEFIPFVLCIKGDTKEHDNHCGKYQSRGKGVSNLCRYCDIKNDDTDEPYKTFTMKTQARIEKLVDEEDFDGLKNISQQHLENCWYTVKFGRHNEQGVHGACPLELLHWLNINKYKYLRSMFFAQTGKDTLLARKMNVLAKTMGYLFKRQSDRDKARTDFTAKGVKKGKLMGHEMTGLIIVLAAVLRSTKGRETLLTESRGKQKEHFGVAHLVKDWALLLETMLQMEAWLKQDELRVYDVRRFGTKIKEVMALEKRIGDRQEGMGFRTFNFHAAVHISDDMLNFGVPANVNTLSNEMHHKPSKTAAIHTQRRAKTFNAQCANNLHDMDVVAYGLEEVNHGNCVWEYYYDVTEESTENNAQDDEENTQSQEDPEDNDAVEVQNSGVRTKFFYSEPEEKYVYTVHSRMKKKHRFQLGQELEDFLATVADELGDDVKHLPLFTVHKRENQIFRGSPYYLGKPWRDWVMVNWGGRRGRELILPAQIWMFLDLEDIPDGLAHPPGTYAIVESAEKNTDEEEQGLSDIFVPFTKETDVEDGDGAVKRKFYLVDVESFAYPCIMIPDVGNDDEAAWLRMKPKSNWIEDFVAWLRDEHTKELGGTR